MAKLRIATYYENRYRNDGACLYTLNQFRQLPEVEIVHFLGDGVIDLKEFGTFDLHLWVDHGEEAYKRPNFPCPKPNLYWVSDMHWHTEGFNFRLKKAEEFDLVTCYHRQFVQPLQAHLKHDRVYWMPVAADPLAYPYEKCLKKYDTSFVGHLNTPQRLDFLDAVFRVFPNSFWSRKLFHEAAAIMHATRVCVNQTVAKDINMRHAEITAAGSMLLTEDSRENGLGELWKVGEEIEVWANVEECIEKLRWYLEHPEEREIMAWKGHQRTLLEHTYRHRVLEMLSLAERHDLVRLPKALKEVVTQYEGARPAHTQTLVTA